MRGSTSVGYDQFETSPEAIEQELRPAVCERRPTDRLKSNYSIDMAHVQTECCSLAATQMCTTLCIFYTGSLLVSEIAFFANLFT